MKKQPVKNFIVTVTKTRLLKKAEPLTVLKCEIKGDYLELFLCNMFGFSKGITKDLVEVLKKRMNGPIQDITLSLRSVGKHNFAKDNKFVEELTIEMIKTNK